MSYKFYKTYRKGGIDSDLHFCYWIEVKSYFILFFYNYRSGIRSGIFKMQNSQSRKYGVIINLVFP